MTPEQADLADVAATFGCPIKAIASGVDEKAKAITCCGHDEAGQRRLQELADEKLHQRMTEAGYMFPDCRCPACLSAREVKS